MAEIPEDQLADLIINSIIGIQTDSGRQELLDWAGANPERERFLEAVRDPETARSQMAIYLSIDPKKGYNKWLERQRDQEKEHHQRKKQRYITLGAAAAVFIAALFLWWKLKSDVRKETAPPGSADTLAMVERTIENNSILTPNGNKTSDTLRILPDGTKVWLNSETKIFYPARFLDSERDVALDGEAYFDVVHNPKKPFVVGLPGGMRVKVLGTRLNLLAYADDDSIVVTLIDGRANFEKNGNTVMLKAGQQITAARNAGGISGPKIVDVEKVGAWKDNKLFYFPDHSNLKTVLKRIARWYHLQLVYKVQISERQECSGEIERDLPVQDVLEMLKYKGIKFTVSNGQIIVEPEGTTSMIFSHSHYLDLLD